MPHALVLSPEQLDLPRLQALDDLPPFGTLQIDFAAALSRALTTSAAARAHPELVALGFWLRPAHVKRLIDELLSGHGQQTELLPRGLAFHIAPGNVDTIFVYSWLLSLLCGNRSIVRLSSRASAQTELLLDTLATLLAEPAWAPIAERVALLRYGHDEAITARLSAACDLRVIWGGDATVNTVRALPLPPHATELCFPDKFSLTVLKAGSVDALDDTALAALARAFCNDAYSFGQMACSSPRLVLWLGDDAATQAARRRLWPAIEARAAQMAHGLGTADMVNKTVAADLLAMQAAVRIEPGPNLVTRVWLHEPAVHAELHCGGGLFHEARLATLDDIAPLLNRRIQTVSHHGFTRDELQTFVRRARPRGIDRFVPVGQALDFAPVWDGLNLWRAFLREVDIRA
ncbi:acyl-CoA reductase [Aquabacterium sp.]|uniref:acyl-CoA reductase n=1 Tax=Aquabacterium sp. TaxID=1872578 RepID=UPI003784C93F